MDEGAWQATVHGGRKESDTTERLSFFLYIYRCVCVCVCVYIHKVIFIFFGYAMRLAGH